MKKVVLNLLSQSLGDTIACAPYASEYQKKNQVEVYYSTNNSFAEILRKSYPNLFFIGRNIGFDYDEKIDLEYIFFKPVQEGYAGQLGFDSPKYIRPVIIPPNLPRTIKNKYITLGVHSTAQLKYWNHPSGLRVQESAPNWDELSSLIRKIGYTPVTVEKDEFFGISPYRNGIPPKSNKKTGQSLMESINLINHSEFYIGLSSGMSWVAHALGKKVAMIANFTEDWNEFDLSLPDYVRITDKSVCHGCWNKINLEYTFDPGDWYWCPKHKGTERQFECHKTITPQMVMEKIKYFYE